MADTWCEEAVPVAESGYSVKGRTCSHCVASVTEEVGETDGVLAARSEQPVPVAKVAAGWPRAGCELPS